MKEHWYHVLLLESLWPDMLQSRAKSLHNLETLLGTDHNLVVLRERVLAEPQFYGEVSEVHIALRLMEKYQNEIRTEAVSMGRLIYREKPKYFALRMKGLWDVLRTGTKHARRAA